jgi:hypothetical protein
MRTLVFFVLLLTVPLHAGEPAIEDLAWMAGHWRADLDGVAMEELWLPPSGGTMLGVHRDVKGARTSFEFIRIATTPEGIVYFAQPGGQPPTPFKLVESTQARAVFANPQHDFPKRIVYWLEEQKLCARVEGDGGEGEQWCWASAGER